MTEDNDQHPGLVQPFRAVRVAAEFAAQVASPPYDVISGDKAKLLVNGNKNSFLRISRAEVDFDARVDPYSRKVYDRAAKNFSELIRRQVLVVDTEPSYYIWRMVTHESSAMGIAGGIALKAYDQGYVRKHELTRPEKEEDRVRHIDALNAHTGPVMLVHRESESINKIISEAIKAKCLYSILDFEGVTHTLWRVSEKLLIHRITQAFQDLSTLYIADGHHRSAAASRLAKNKQKTTNQYFLGVAISSSQMQIRPYNRVVRDLNGSSISEFLKKVSQTFIVSRNPNAVIPFSPKTFGLYIDKCWYKLELKSSISLGPNIEDQLDVSILSDFLLTPILGIKDLRSDDRIDFVGGSQGINELMRQVDSRLMVCGFSLFPTRIKDLITVADENRIMPPKSTYFEPKLVDGLVSMLVE